MNRFSRMPELPEEIRVEETPDGVRFVFPVRNWPARWTAWIFLILGILLVAFALVLPTMTTGVALSMAGLIVLAVSACIGITGLLLCISAQHTFIGHVEIDVRGEHLRAIEVVGWLRWSRSRPIKNIKRLLVTHEWYAAADAGAYAKELKEIAYRLAVECEDGRKRKLVKWYSQDRLEPVAHELSRRLELPEPVMVIPAKAEDDEAERDVSVQPEGSTMVLERTADGLNVLAPPLQLFGGKSGRSITGIVGGGAAGAGAGIFTLSMFGGGMWWMWLALSLPALAGVAFVAAGMLGQRETFFDVVGDTLLISTKGLRGIAQHQWKRDEIKAIKCGESLVEISDEHLPQLHVVPRDGEPVRLLTGRSNEELRWLAHTLCEALDIEQDEADQEED